MSRQYKRIYDLTIIPEEGEARVIRDLRIQFEITKSVISLPNVAKITIYNPNDDTVSLLQKKFTSIVLNAGYEGNSRLLYKGQLRNVFPQKTATDRALILYAGDGQRDWENATFNKTFVENVSIQNVVKEIIQTFKDAAVGALEGLPAVADKLRGQTLSGASRNLLDQFADEYGFNWSVQDGEITTVPVNTALQGTEAVLINAKTGMIGSPVVTERGVEVTTLLNPVLRPNGSFQIESLGAEVQLGNLFLRNVTRTSGEGLYKIQEVIFRGDNRDGDWLTIVKGIPINV